LARPLVSELAIEREPDKDLAKPLTSDELRPNEAVNALPSPLAPEPVRDSEPPRVLSKEVCSVRLDDMVSEPVRVLMSET